MLRNWSAVSKAIFEGFLLIFEAILGPKMEPKSKKNGIKNKSDFMTKLYGRKSAKEGVTWTGPARLGAPKDAPDQYQKQRINQSREEGTKG